MQTRVRKKRRVIFSKDAEEYERLFNEASEELKPYRPEIKDVEQPGAFCTYFTYELDEKVPEQGSVKDEFELEGIVYTCEQCPHLEMGNDKRRKRWPCKYSPWGVSQKDCTACERFYRELAQGMVKVRQEV